MTTPKVQVLDFFTDDDKSSALTVLVNGVRFHIIANAENLKARTQGGIKLQHEYSHLVAASKREQSTEEKDHQKWAEGGDEKDNDEAQEEDIWCICRKPENGQKMIACENEDCKHQWYHFDCVGLESAPKGEWICSSCRESSPASDSGVDVTTPETTEAKLDVKAEVAHSDLEGAQPEQRLQNWMLSSFGPVFAPLAPMHKEAGEQTLAEWYNSPTHFYDIKIQGSKLVAIELEETDELKKRMDNLTPRLKMPKYITNLDIPFHNPADMVVIDESDMLGPLRPSRVRLGDHEHFIKIVDPSLPDATKREIKLLKQIEKLGLHKEIKVPQVIGLVGDGTTSKDIIIGFLQTDIESPTPLTHMLDSEISQTKRNRWAKESKRIVDVLHDHDIIFGDCKADNFLVDAHDELWIIDFGGSYTEGWIEPRLAETEEGDDLALEKIVNALHDPEANTIDVGGSEEDAEKKGKGKDSGKRKREDEQVDSCAGWEAGYERSTKSQKLS